MPSLGKMRISRISSRQARLDLNDARVVRVGGYRGTLENGALVDSRRVERHLLEVVAARQLDRRRLDRRDRATSRRNLRGRLRGALHRVPVEPFHVCVPRGVPLLDPNPETHRNASRSALQDALVVDQAPSRSVLEIKVCVVPAAPQRDP